MSEGNPTERPEERSMKERYIEFIQRWGFFIGFACGLAGFVILTHPCHPLP